MQVRPLDGVLLQFEVQVRWAKASAVVTATQARAAARIRNWRIENHSGKDNGASEKMGGAPTLTGVAICCQTFPSCAAAAMQDVGQSPACASRRRSTTTL
ncbi:hypothetical protein AB4Z37_09940 [Bradyrhizobium sp. 2TAF24]